MENNILELLEENGIQIENPNFKIEQKHNHVYLSLYGESSIISGNFGSTFIHLYDNASIKGGEFGNVSNVVLYDNSHIEGGNFNGDISLYDNTFINEGVLNCYVYLDVDSKMINADLGNCYGVIISNGWHYDNLTIELLDESGIDYRFEPIEINV